MKRFDNYKMEKIPYLVGVLAFQFLNGDWRCSTEHICSICDQVISSKSALGMRKESLQVLEGTASHQNASLTSSGTTFWFNRVHTDCERSLSVPLD